MASGLLNLSVVGDAMRLDTDIGQLARDDVWQGKSKLNRERVKRSTPVLL